MANKQKSEFSAEAKKQHTVFSVGVAIVVKLNCAVIKEDSGSLFKGHSGLVQVSLGFCWIPFKFYLSHKYNVTTMSLDVKSLL